VKPKWSKRLRARYVSIHLHGECRDAYSALVDTYRNLFGEVSLGLSGLKQVKLSGNVSREVLTVRVWHTFLNNLRASVALLRCGDQPLQAHVVAVSGTVMGLEDLLRKRGYLS